MTDECRELEVMFDVEERAHLKPETETATNVQPDGGWGWVVCFACFICNGTVFGLILATGILYVAIEDKFGKDDDDSSTKAALVGSLCIGLTFCMCFVAGIASERIGTRQTGLIGGVLSSAGIISSAFVNDIVWLWLTLGVILGVGLAFLFNSCFVILPHYFRRRIGVAFAIFTLGGNTFGFALSLGLSPLLDAVGFRYAMLILSSLALITIPCTLTWKPLIKLRDRGEVGTPSSKSYSNNPRCQCVRNCLDVALWRKKHYLVLILAQILHYVAYSPMLVHLVNYMKETFPDEKHSLVIMYLTITASIVQICIGKVVDTKIISQVTMMSLAHGMYGVIVVCIPWIPNYILLVIVILVMGVAQGTFVCLTGPLTVALVGSEHASQAFGFMLGVLSLPTTIIPPLVGLLYDKLGSYHVAFHIVGCFPVVSMILMCLIPKASFN